MVREATSFLMSRLFSASIESDWMEPPSRGRILHVSIIPYLQSLRYHLSSPSYLSSLLPTPSVPLDASEPITTLTAAAASIASCLSFLSELYPSLLEDTEYKKVFDLMRSVEARPRIKEWIESGARVRNWTRTAGGGAYLIKSDAERFDNKFGNRFTDYDSIGSGFEEVEESGI